MNLVRLYWHGVPEALKFEDAPSLRMVENGGPRPNPRLIVTLLLVEGWNFCDLEKWG